MFNGKGYPEIQLSELCKKITDGTHKTPKYLGEGVTFISAKNIINGRLDFSDVKYISEAEYQEIQKRCQTEKGDVLLAKSGSLGMTAIVETDESLGLFESLAILKYDRTLLNGVFLCRQMQSDTVQSQLMSNVKGVAVKHLHLNVIAKTKIIVPPMDLQERFCAFARQSDKSKFELKKAIESCNALMKAILFTNLEEKED
jgi:type I restriction enzyme S subunit